MPLIDIRCRREICPPDDGQEYPSEFWRSAVAIESLVDQLPGIVAARGTAMHLDPGTPAGAVQVDLAPFHRVGKNRPDLWIKVTLTEGNMPKEHRLEARDQLIEIIVDWITISVFASTWALDLFVSGYGHGCISDAEGAPGKRW